VDNLILMNFKILINPNKRINEDYILNSSLQSIINYSPEIKESKSLEKIGPSKNKRCYSKQLSVSAHVFTEKMKNFEVFR